MTPADLDRIERDVEDEAHRHSGLLIVSIESLRSLIRLARRGLRAETETCGRCGHATFERGKYRCHTMLVGQDADGYCSEWSSKENERGR